MTALNEEHNIENKRTHLPFSDKYVDLSISVLKGHNILFGILKDVTDAVNYNNKLSQVKLETLTTTDGVIQKQMRVAQEIASLLGETTAETKVALLKLKEALQKEEKGDQ